MSSAMPTAGERSGPARSGRAWRIARATLVAAVAALAILAAAGAVLWNWPRGFHATATWAFRTLHGLSLESVEVDGWAAPALRGGPESPSDPVPIVFLHGFGTSKEAMTMPMSWVKGTRQVWAPDLPGFGDHDLCHGEAYGPEQYVQWIEEFRNAIGAQRMDLVGTSMGGAFAAAYAAGHPDRVRRLVLLAPAGVDPPVRNEFMRAADRGENPLDIQDGEDFDRIVNTVFLRPPAIPAPFRQAMIDRAVSRRADWLAIVERIRPFLFDGVRPLLPAVDAPTLVIFGAKDAVTDPSMLGVFARGIARVKPVLIPDGGHVIFADSPREVSREIRSFLLDQGDLPLTPGQVHEPGGTPPRAGQR
ncbi:MAG: alpha/beta hydrolase [Phycisphaerales bacterium]|nr:alpha/beta hydrolase [Phycisphaerales bacterium]